MKKKDVLELTDKELDKLIKIESTQYDRRRKLNDKQLDRIKSLVKKGKSLEYIAGKFNVKVNTIRYHVDEAYRDYIKARANYCRSASCRRASWKETLEERARYKRQLVARGKLDV